MSVLPTVPKGQTVRILRSDSGQPLIDKIMYLENDISLGISSSFQPILSGGGVSPLLTAVAAGIPFLADKGLTGQFKQQGFRIWKSTEPLELKLSVSLRFKTSARQDVMKPAIEIMKMAVPAVADNGWGLIPPGPSIYDVIGEVVEAFGVNTSESTYDFLDTGNSGLVNIRAGALTIQDCIIQNVIPTFSKWTDTSDYAIKCTLDIDIITKDIANKQMLDDLLVPDTV